MVLLLCNTCVLSTGTPVQVDGSIVVWDLHESSRQNELYTDGDGNSFYLRQPSYNTGNLHTCTLTMHT